MQMARRLRARIADSPAMQTRGASQRQPRLAMSALAVAAAGASCLYPLPADAGCASTPITGGLLVVCDAATAPDPTNPLVAIPSGNNVVQIFSGTYNGGFSIAGGNNSITVSGGQINAGFISGAGIDQFAISAGAITGNVDQGDGTDSFTMSGGQIGSLQQGGGLDTFFMSGGTIVGGFTEGDFITIVGGSIGSVDMTIGNNVFSMSGGTVVGNVVAGFQNDTFTLSGGTIGGNVNLGNGTDSFVVSGGSIGAGITGGTGVDTLTWSGGVIAGAIDLAANNDNATLSNLSATNIAGTTLVSGGLGTDQLTLSNSVVSVAGLLQNWETVALTNGTQLTLTGNLVLGDSGSGTGALSIDGSSALFATGAVAIQAFTPGQLAAVTNSGAIDLTAGLGGATDRLTIVGNYVGAGGLLNLNTVLGGDGSPSDLLIIDTGAASGTTGLQVVNLGGAGALTTGNGIAVVTAQNGGTTGGTAFALAAPVAAGPFQYLLFRGPLGAGTVDEENSWFLRSQLVEPDGDVVPLYRPETSIYASLPGVARTLALSTLGTFHERYGDQSGVRGGSGRAWGRIFGEHTKQGSTGPLDAKFDGFAGGVQLGIDVARFRGDDGNQDAGGVFFGLGQADGDVDGFAIGVPDAFAGTSQLHGPSFGAYLTHIGPGDWYVDAVGMVSFIGNDGVSTNNVATNVGATGAFLSLEVGVPILLWSGVSLEPQAQLIYQHLDVGGTTDAFSTVTFDTPDALTGRLGLRLAGLYGAYRPYLKVNVWRDWSGTDETTYSGVYTFTSKDDSTALEVGGGVVGEVSQTISWWGVVDYTTEVAGNDLEAIRGNAGVKVSW
jgi:autotransporter family porin